MPPVTRSRYIESLPPFEPFPFLRLPPELRRLIWKLTLPGPQIHKVVYRRRCPPKKNPKNHDYHVVSPRTPITLSICQESRAVARETLIQFPHCQCLGPVGLSYFNPKIDILFVNARGDDDTWDAPWVSFTQLSFDLEIIWEGLLKNISRTLLRRPVVSRIYFTELEVDEEMRAIAKVRRDISQWDLKFPEHLLGMTKCVSITELDVVHDKGMRDRLEEMTSVLCEEGKSCDLHIDIAEAKICCTCS
ncbi:uncharacterized protein B0J16DRAFT_351279 [Fusarium flagelliforme]|uniref:uncharacterized protein n=1 Tax=Fusarium flagelliforme TaxID=2675880 RepID=UPI001E8CA319|nr:uncharacterized protein B0J16DRAFT_351279 [Fusarium flagelliforme]KAH7174052.1 hypothetical protein B0J16DRAFT_351279 [Fusarium flagelliforme]